MDKKEEQLPPGGGLLAINVMLVEARIANNSVGVCTSLLSGFQGVRRHSLSSRWYVFSHSRALHAVRQTKLLRALRFQGSGTGVPPVRIVQPTHGRDARATTV